jgi:hypothetical protein
MTSPALDSMDRAPRASVAAWPEYLTQVLAADYLSVSDRWFRDNVHVQPVPVGEPKPGKKPVLRYRRVDLDAWVQRCATFKLRKG